MHDLSHLNVKQKQAVLYKGERLALIAGAGSGKTRTFTDKIAYLIKDKDVPPQYIMATAFTRKSAEEITERLVPMIGEHAASRVRMGTFHSISNSIYKDIMTKKRAGFRPPKLVNKLEVWNLIRKVAKDNDFINQDVKRIISQISLWKNQCQLPKMLEDKYAKQLGTARAEHLRMVGDILAYKEYQKYLRDKNKRDYDDMLLDTALALANPNYAAEVKSIRRRIKYILIDEAQDTNLVQFAILKHLIGPIEDKKNVMIVGDDWQSIYGFRGSDIDHFKKFLDVYDFDIMKLEQNYRSTKEIVSVGNKLIKHNATQIEKTLHTDNMQGAKTEVFYSEDEEYEATQLVDKIGCLVSEGFSFSDIAIIYRVNAQSRAIVDQFVGHNIPHKVYAKYSFYDRSEIKDILAYIRILHNPYNGTKEDYQRIINKPSRYLGAAAIDAIHDVQLEEGYETFYEALLNSYKANFSKPFMYDACSRFVGDIDHYHDIVHKGSYETSRIITLILKSIGYEKFLIKDDIAGIDDEGDDDKMMNLDALFEGAQRYPEVEAYFKFLKTIKDEHDSEEDFIHCMTVHKSKGLEFPVVFVIGMCDKIFPHSKSVEEGKLEDERRVAYVAVTRAQEYLYLGVINGKFGRFKVGPSPFIKEMGLGKREDIKYETKAKIAPPDRRKQPTIQRLPYLGPKN